MRAVVNWILLIIILKIRFDTCHTKSPYIPEGSSCYVDGYNGTCLSIYKCYQMIQVLIDKKKPKICSYDGIIPIVCCTECSVHHVEDISKAVMESQSGILWKNGRKAWDKCLNYVNNNEYPCKSHYSTGLKELWNEDMKCHQISTITVAPSNSDDTTMGEFPHMALLGYGEDMESAQWLCGGSLISETFILTAAHCISTPRLGLVKYVALGVLKRSDPPAMWQRYPIKTRIPHPDYQSPVNYHDIALLETTYNVQFTSLALPACLPVKPVIGISAQAAGWGHLGYKRPLADILQKIQVQKFSDEECAQLYEPHRLLSDGYNSTIQMCFGDHEHASDTCEGDSGGPLFISEGCRFNVIGVTSFGVTCGVKGNAGMYTRVEPYVPWIESIVWP